MDYRQTAGFSRSCHVLYESLGILSRCLCVRVCVFVGMLGRLVRVVFDGESGEAKG